MDYVLVHVFLFSRTCTSTGLDGGIIAGIVIACVFGCALCVVAPIVLICCLCFCKKKSNPGMVMPQYQPQAMYGTPMYNQGQPWQPPPYPPPPPPSTYPIQENTPKY